MASTVVTAADDAMVQEQPVTNHNPALDGLRAVAVLAVIGFHANFGFLAGGYLGVDIFFVLSGFLITRLLITQRERNGALSLQQFWSARARRLFPALAVVLVAVATVGSGAAALEQHTIFNQGLATLTYSNNWLEMATAGGYFEQFQHPSPLMHTWSLGVEEQWYVIFPFIVIAIAAAKRTNPRSMMWWFAGLAVTSALWSSYLCATGASMNRLFFGTDVRAQELLIGATVACLSSVQPQRRPGKGSNRWPHYSAGAALALVVAMLALVPGDSRWLFAGGTTVFCIAVAVVIWFVVDTQDEPRSLGRALGWRPLAWVGLISYGLYLWHWPLIVWIRGSSDRLTLAQALLAVCATFAFAFLSFHLLEQPVRRRQIPLLRGRGGWIALLVAPILMIALLAATTLDRPLANTRAPNGFTQASSTRHATAHSSKDMPRVFFVGDSQSLDLRRVFPALKTPNFELAGSSWYGCGLTPALRVYKGTIIPKPVDCSVWARQWPEDLAAYRPDLSLAFISVQFHYDQLTSTGAVVKYGTPEYRAWFTGQLDEITATLRESSQKVGLVNSTCNRMTVGEGPEESNSDQRTREVNQFVANYVAAHPDLHLLDLAKWDCGNSPGEATQLAKARKLDGLHYTTVGAMAEWQWLAPLVRSTAAN